VLLHTFYSDPSSGDGAYPGLGGAGLYSGSDGGVYVASDGTIYGTTSEGGDLSCDNGTDVGCGVIFSLSPSGTYTVVHTFEGGTDGWNPFAQLTAGPDGALYGVTNYGGTAESDTACVNGSLGCGTVFKIDPSSNAETVLHRFTGGEDGSHPWASLTVDANGNIFGTTAGNWDATLAGGGLGGTVFEITSNGTYKVLYVFKGPDGLIPASPLTLAGDMLYGTATAGGGKGCTDHKNPAKGCGVAFALMPPGLDNKTWKYVVLHRFDGKTDGGGVSGGLIPGPSGFYGVTISGGLASDGNDSGSGTAFTLFGAPVAKQGAPK
jgi:uncharacterized repeat protein (TIGR03803 family)